MSDLVLHQPTEVPPIEYVGVPARADLLPREIRSRAESRASRRLAVLLVILAIALVGAGYALVWASSLDAESRLVAAQSRTAQLSQQQAEFQSVRDLQGRVRVASAAARVGSSTAVEWAELVGHITGPLPADASITSLSITMRSPLVSVPPASGPLAAPRIGQIQLAATGSDLGGVLAWLGALKADPRFSAVDVASATGPQGWAVSLTLSVAPPPPPTGEVAG